MTVLRHLSLIDDEDRRLSEYCDYVLGSLTRADQRRWGEIYIRGLLHLDGRRSVRRIADSIGGGGSDQSLQQFINQSPWDYYPVRRRIAEVMADLDSVAWVLDEVVFVKRGAHSAGIDRQYVASKGRLTNCQIGTVALLAGGRGHVPVNWRLAIPQSWDSDQIRRKRAHIPQCERYQPHWRYQIEMLDDLSGDWGVPLAPVVLNARHCDSVYLLIGELANRGLDHLVDVTGDTLLRCRLAARPPGVASAQAGSWSSTAWLTFAQLAGTIPPDERTTVIWRAPDSGRKVRSQFAAVPVRISPPAEMMRLGGSMAEAFRALLVEWPLGRQDPRGAWLTNMRGRSINLLASLTKLHPSARHEVNTLADSLGLGHHEGRSFLGWHHHVTLVSAARAFQVLNATQDPDSGDLLQPHLRFPGAHSGADS